MRRAFHWTAAALVFPGMAYSQTYIIQTFAGGGVPSNIPGASAILGRVSGVASDNAGNIYIASPVNASSLVYPVVVRVNLTSGLLTLVAGTGISGHNGDNGPATNAQLSFPSSLAFKNGNLYIADGNWVRKVANGVITTVAGGGSQFADNVLATSTRLNASGIAVDNAENLYITDTLSNRVRKITNGVITTVAGNGTVGFSGDGNSATSAQLALSAAVQAGIAVDTAGNIYFTDYGNVRIRKVSNGVITTVAGNGMQSLGSGDNGDNGPATSGALSNPAGIAIDPSGSSLYIANSSGNNSIRKVVNDVIFTIAGGGVLSFTGDNGPALGAGVISPQGVALDDQGNYFIADSGNGRVRKVASLMITTIAGSGVSGLVGDNGPATSGQLVGPADVAVDSASNVYIADGGNARVRKVSASNSVITTVAGNGGIGPAGDGGPATAAALLAPSNLALDFAKNLYITDTGQIRRVSATGDITTVLANAAGPAAVDAQGNIYIADKQNHQVIEIAGGLKTVIAGTGTPGFSGDNGLPTSAQLFQPTRVILDSLGRVFVIDSGNSRIRRIIKDVMITTVAGNGTVGDSGDNGPATSAGLSAPLSLAVDSSGNLFIGVAGSRVRRVSNAVITTVAGTGVPGFTGDNGPAANARLGSPIGLAADTSGNVYVADQLNSNIRVLISSGSVCSYNVTPTTLQHLAAGGNSPISIQTDAACLWSVTGLPSWITVSGAATGTGPATVTLVVAANSGVARSATLAVAGVTIAVNQAGAATTGCTYTISPGGQAFAAAGGSGSFTVTTTAACSWATVSASPWITGTVAGTGNGTAIYQVAANVGAARSGSISIADKSFTVEQAALAFPFTSSASLPHFVVEGSWESTITLVNTGSSTAQARLNFFRNGNAWTLPLTFPPASSSASPLLASTIDRTLNPGAILVIKSTGPGADFSDGWVQLLTNGTIAANGNFRSNIGSSDQQIGVPFETRNGNAYVFPFDNTGTLVTAVALTNTGTQAGNAGIVIRDDTGNMVLSTTITLGAQAHTAFLLPSLYPAFTAGKRGTVEFDAPSGGQISTLGIVFDSATRAFGNIPVLTRGGATILGP